MENFENITNEVVETGMEMTNTGSGWIGLAILAASAFTGAVIWERGVKPLSRRITTKIKGMKKPDLDKANVVCEAEGTVE